MAPSTQHDTVQATAPAGGLLPHSMREKVLALEAAMLADPESFKSRGERNIDDLCPVRHHFSKGVYAREMFIPKGATVVGKIHKHENLAIMTMGELAIVTDDGVEVVKAPYTAVSPAGTKRAVHALEDSIFISVHSTDERDLAKIEQEFIAQTEQEYLDFCRALELKGAGL